MKASVTRSFAEMIECINQHRAGLLHDAELILALQCDQFQVEAMRQLLALPQNAVFKLSLSDFDPAVDDKRAKNCESAPERARNVVQALLLKFEHLALSRCPFRLDQLYDLAFESDASFDSWKDLDVNVRQAIADEFDMQVHRIRLQAEVGQRVLVFAGDSTYRYVEKTS